MRQWLGPALAVALLLPGAAFAQQAVVGPIDVFGEVIDAPTIDLAVYQRRRELVGLSEGAPIGDLALSDVARIEAIETLLDEGNLAAERWLLAQAAQAGQLDRVAWRLWDDALQATDGTRRRVRLVRALHFTSGNAAAMLPPSCWSPDEMLIEAQEPARRAIAAIGDGRLRSSFDGALSMFEAADAATRAALDALDGRVDDEHEAPAECSAALVASVVAAAGATDDIDRLLPLVIAAADAELLPRQVWLRFSVHRYLSEDVRSLTALRAALDDTEAGWPIDVMVAGLERDGTTMLDIVGTRSGGGPVELFVIAESRRISGQYEDALPIYNALLETDGLFAAAVFGRAATLIALGREDDALTDLEHARLAFDETPIYARWVDALGRRLAP